MKLRPPQNRTSGVVLECAIDIPIKATAWIFSEWLPRGMLALLAGMPGSGKTGIALEIAARISNGDSRRGRWAGGLMAPYGSVVILTYEDDVNTTIMSRLVANDADLRKIHVVRGTARFDGEIRAFDFGKDLEQLLRKVDEIGDVVLVIIDPVISVVKGDALKNQEVRESFGPLISRAESRQFTILGITHFNKGTAKKHPLERITGSGAFTQLARTVLVAVKVEVDDVDAPSRKQGLLMRAKMLGPEGDAYVYEIDPVTIRASSGDWTDTARIVWPDVSIVQGSAKKLIAWAENGGSSGASVPTKVEDAEVFLIQSLSDGRVVPAKEIEMLATEAGISLVTLIRARQSLGIISTKERGPQGNMRAVLSLPERGAMTSPDRRERQRVPSRRQYDSIDDEYDRRERPLERRPDHDDQRQQWKENRRESYSENRDQVEQVDRVVDPAPGNLGSHDSPRLAVVDLFNTYMRHDEMPNEAEIWGAAADLLRLEEGAEKDDVEGDF